MPEEMIDVSADTGSADIQENDAASGRSSVVPAANETTVAASEGEVPAIFVYALGRIEARYPSAAVEKEFAQVAAQADNGGLTDQEILHRLLHDGRNRYLARQICWVFSVEGIDTYVLSPRDPRDFDLLIESVRPTQQRREDVDVVIGVLGGIAPPEMCGGIMLPIVAVDQIYSFDVDSFVKELPRPKGVAEKAFRATAEELLGRVMQIADNAGATDEDRALNYLTVRYPAIYRLAAEAHERNASLSSVEVTRSRLSGARNIVKVIFAYTDRKTDVVDKYFVRVDVTEEFPFLITKLGPFYDR